MAQSRTWLDRPVKVVLVGVEGVLLNETTAVPKSLEALRRLKTSGICVRLFSNDTQVGREIVRKSLVNAGYMWTQTSQLDTPNTILAEWLEAQEYRPVFLMSRAKSVIQEYKDVLKPSAEHPANCLVILDTPETLTPPKMEQAVAILEDMKLRGLPMKVFSLGPGTYADVTVEGGENKVVMTSGQLAANLWMEMGPEVDIQLVSKPSPFFLEGVLKRVYNPNEGLNFLPQDAVVIGDDILLDVKAAGDAGFRGLIVRSGGKETTHPYAKADGILENFCQGVDLILSTWGAHKRLYPFGKGKPVTRPLADRLWGPKSPKAPRKKRSSEERRSSSCADSFSDDDTTTSDEEYSDDVFEDEDAERMAAYKKKPKDDLLQRVLFAPIGPLRLSGQKISPIRRHSIPFTSAPSPYAPLDPLEELDAAKMLSPLKHETAPLLSSTASDPYKNPLEEDFESNCETCA